MDCVHLLLSEPKLALKSFAAFAAVFLSFLKEEFSFLLSVNLAQIKQLPLQFLGPLPLLNHQHCELLNLILNCLVSAFQSKLMLSSFLDKLVPFCDDLVESELHVDKF